MLLRPLAFLTLLTLAPTLGAQAPNSSATAARAREALAPIQRLVGQWEGDARAWEGPSDPIRVRQSEDIVFGAARTMIFIRGTGRDPSTGNVIFEAAASLWFDDEAKRLRMRTHRDGRGVEPDVELRPDTLIWSFAIPTGRVRYVIALTDSTWHEVGTYERAGAAPIRTIEMHLRKTSR